MDLIRQAAEDIARCKDGADWIERVIRDVVARECEACAALAEHGGISADGDVGRQIAALIRTRNKTR